MTSIHRALVLLAIVTAGIMPLPVAAAEDCIAVSTATFSDSLRVIANAGRQIAVGVKSTEPGNGAAVVVVITPSVCSGFGVGGFTSVGEPIGLVEHNGEPLPTDITFLPLP